MDMWNVIVQGGSSVQINRQGDGMHLLVIMERNIVNAFKGYMRSLKDSVNIMPKEAAGAEIRQLIQELQMRLVEQANNCIARNIKKRKNKYKSMAGTGRT